jgi:hypothetical protein
MVSGKGGILMSAPRRLRFSIPGGSVAVAFAAVGAEADSFWASKSPHGSKAVPRRMTDRFFFMIFEL